MSHKERPQNLRVATNKKCRDGKSIYAVDGGPQHPTVKSCIARVGGRRPRGSEEEKADRWKILDVEIHRNRRRLGSRFKLLHSGYRDGRWQEKTGR